ncbi:MAG TPA: TIGR03560 family F420-dependent LLM class oxidoreductase [Solirubrobacteraceae bacterium]|jgi:F420-dependent oxidoreductase-like protein|nr:TIGR03560 family F420-dependent LLM class oxidoreductase [Solirubrobacteraceae bacterium]
MDLCLMIEGQEGVDWPQWRALAAACEEHAIPALFRSDHYLNLDGGHPERGSLDAWATLNGLAAVTSKLRLGTMVSPATFRHPSELAKLVTTADHISDGRIELGLGAGWNEREHTAYGFAFPGLRARMDILEEQLQVVHGNWSDGPFSFQGAHYRLDDLDAQPKPLQRPHPPLLMGGAAGPRSCALAARFADEYNTAYPTVAMVRERRQRVVEACERAGREAIPFSIMTAVIAGADAADLRERLARVARARGGDGAALAAQPPPGWVIGTVEEAAEQLIELRDAGVSRVLCQHLAHDDVEFVALLGDELAPLVSGR